MSLAASIQKTDMFLATRLNFSAIKEKAQIFIRYSGEIVTAIIGITLQQIDVGLVVMTIFTINCVVSRHKLCSLDFYLIILSLDRFQDL